MLYFLQSSNNNGMLQIFFATYRNLESLLEYKPLAHGKQFNRDEKMRGVNYVEFG